MNEKKCRALVYERSNHVCEVCGQGRGSEVHHRKNRSQGGLWTPDNALHVCIWDHRWITVNPAGAREQGWSVRRNDDPATTPVRHAWHGLVLLTPDGSVEPVQTTGEAA